MSLKWIKGRFPNSIADKTPANNMESGFFCGIKGFCMDYPFSPLTKGNKNIA